MPYAVVDEQKPVQLTERLPAVSVIVPTFNRKSNLPRVLRPLLDDPATSEVVAVVDGCRDGSFELLEEWAVDERRIRPVFTENRGTSGAHQVGVENASGEIVLLLADDVVASPKLVTGHALRHAHASGLVVVGYMPTVTPVTRKPGQFASFLYALEYERICEAYEREPTTVLKHLWGGNVSLRRIDCQRVPVHVEQFQERYHEDQDFGIRCLKAGLVGVFDRSLLASHIHSRALDQFLSDARKEGAGRLLLHRLHSDILPPLTVDAFGADAPRTVALLMRVCQRSAAVHRSLSSALSMAVRVAGSLRMFRLETLGAQVLRRVEQQQGAMTLRA